MISLIYVVLLAASPALAFSQTLDDRKAAAMGRLRTRQILEGRNYNCTTVDCHNNGEADCWAADPTCVVCSHTYYCANLPSLKLPTVDEMVIDAGGFDVKGKPMILTNFMEGSQLKDQWAPVICPDITNVRSDQDEEAGIWHWTVQGTHKRVMSLTHKGEFLDMLVTWVPNHKALLPQFDSMKVDLCKKAFELAAQNYHQLHYGSKIFHDQWVPAVKNRHSISISTPPLEVNGRKLKRGRAGDTIAFINIEFGDHNKDILNFKGTGLPT